MTAAVAIVGMACRYPDARTPQELWENVLSRRRAFRQLPPERLRLEDYFSSSRDAPDRTYAAEAAVIDGFEFDRAQFRVSGEAFRSADTTHWLALDVASRALEDAGYSGGSGLPLESTGVLLGNTLTGEFARANAIRLRWPFVRRVLKAALAAEQYPPELCEQLIRRIEDGYKRPFPETGDESLAGGLSNTIAGRICNHFHLKGGGFTVDGACASSLLAVAGACSALTTGDLDVAVAGGVDLSLDPFELVGFAKAGALASGEMRVYDRRPTGFLPGEGCGFVVLMRAADALAADRRIYAVIRGWGISSDGTGGITRPEADGQTLALRRAYRRAGIDPADVPYFEGHGTGTGVGDSTELEALASVRGRGISDPPAALGSIKANIGHTKAAAGLAGLIKAVAALHHQVLPPTTGCTDPHPLIADARSGLRVADEGECWPLDRPLYAGVSAMGFGGINTHLVLEGRDSHRRRELSARDRALLRSPQDAELFCLSANSRPAILARIESIIRCAAWLSHAQLADLAAHLAGCPESARVRVAVVASSPTELAGRLETVRSWVSNGETERLDARSGMFLGTRRQAPRIGFVFPGQTAPLYRQGQAWSRRFDEVRELYDGGWNGGDAAAIVQPAIVTASLAGLGILARLELNAELGIGHSLGELVALHWARAMDERTLLRVAAARGCAMARTATGTMAAIMAGETDVLRLLDGSPAIIACLNSPRQTVIAGAREAVEVVVARAQARGIGAVMLPVWGAFHSPLVAGAVPPLADHLARETLRLPTRQVFSGVTGSALAPTTDLKELLCRQVTSPVRFTEAVAAAGVVDLWIEVGPGATLAGPLAEMGAGPLVSLDASGKSLGGLLRAVGAAFALGAHFDLSALFSDRLLRAIDPEARPKFLANPCEQAPQPVRQRESLAGRAPGAPIHQPSTPPTADPPTMSSTAALVRELVAKRVELPVEQIVDERHLLRDFHLSSIAIGQIVAESARRLQLPVPGALTDFAHATVGQLARALLDLAEAPGVGSQGAAPPGVDNWVRPFGIEWVDQPVPKYRPTDPAAAGVWRVIGPSDHPIIEPLRKALGRVGQGVGICLPPDPGEDQIPLLLEAAREALRRDQPGRFVLVQHGRGGGAFARTFHLEFPNWITCVVNVPYGHPDAAEWVAAEAVRANGFVEVRYEPDGRRRVPVLRPILSADPVQLDLDSSDVLLVTGGGKGIAAECAASLAASTQVRIGLIGRGIPAEDPILTANIARFRSNGIRLCYAAADVTDPEAVRRAVSEIERELGPITAILHGAGRNEPCALGRLDEEAFRATVGPKLAGARNVIAAIDPARLRLLVTFGSVIARAGLPGEADYAAANEWLAAWTEQFGIDHPACRCLAVEWSIWSGVGMGERLGRVEALSAQGISPISPDQGIEVLNELLRRRLPAAVVVSGRLGNPPTLEMEQPELPFLRFLERPLIHYPGIELVVEADLSMDTDPYIADHVFEGEPLLPAVLGLEAMLQTARTLTQTFETVVFEQVRFDRPIPIPAGCKVTIRIAALRRACGRVEVAVRSSLTAYQIDHFRATCRPGTGREELAGAHDWGTQIESDFLPVLDSNRDLYGGLLFQTGRFRRIRGYRVLRARECVAELAPGRSSGWFAPYLPGDLLLGDPGVRDAAIHAVQACIPHAVVLPIGVDRITSRSVGTTNGARVRAKERAQEGDTFIYDLEIADDDGRLRERWEGLRLRRVTTARRPQEWAPALLGPYVERRLAEFVGGAAVQVALVVRPSGAPRLPGESALDQLLGLGAGIARRPDGKLTPGGGGDIGVSVSHTDGLTLLLAGTPPVACDVERIIARPGAAWQDLIGAAGSALARAICSEAAEDLDVAATRVWSSRECVKKAGGGMDAPLVFVRREPDGWVILRVGKWVVATLGVAIRGATGAAVIGALIEAKHEDV